MDFTHVHLYYGLFFFCFFSSLLTVVFAKSHFFTAQEPKCSREKNQTWSERATRFRLAAGETSLRNFLHCRHVIWLLRTTKRSWFISCAFYDISSMCLVQCVQVRLSYLVIYWKKRNLTKHDRYTQHPVIFEFNWDLKKIQPLPSSK